MQVKNIFFLLIVSILLYYNGFSQITTNSQYIIFASVKIEGNKITKENIIKRELTFKKGDTLQIDLLSKIIERNKENILNTSLFNYVNINAKFIEPNLINIVIDVEERWYIWPYPIFEHADRNFSNFINDKDWSRVNYGGFLSVYNLRGRNELLKVKARLGYKEQYALTYGIPYFDNKKKHGISLSVAHNRQKEIAYTNIDNRLQYFKNNEEYLYSSDKISLDYIFRNKLYLKHILSINYNNVNISDTVSVLNSNFFNSGQLSSEYLIFAYSLIYDSRNLIYFPTRGKYYSINISKTGAGILPKGNVNFFKISSNLKNYFKLNGRLFYSSKLKGLKSFGDINSYYFENAFGYDEVLRGYEYYVIYGQDYCVFNNSLKWNIIPDKTTTIKALPFSKFNKIHFSVYADIFFDTGYVWDKNYFSQNNYMANQYLYSGGIGLNFITYYDKVLILEFSVNKFGEAGIFINFEAPI